MSFVEEVREEAGPNLCKVGTFLNNQNTKALKKADKEPITDESLHTAKDNFPQAAILGALRKRGLNVTSDSLRKHLTKACQCSTEAVTL